MTDIVPEDINVESIEAEVKRDYDQDEPESFFYVEKSTGFIYEVKLFPECALIRPAHPDFASSVEKVDLINFARNFDEYAGDCQAIRDYLWGASIDGVEIEKK